MTSISAKPASVTACYVSVILLAASCLAFSQDQQNVLPPPQQQTLALAPGWRHFSGPPPSQTADPPNQNDSSDPNISQNLGSNSDQPSNPSRDTQSQSIPTRLVIRPGAFITVRLDQMLSSNRNQVGDVFTATLAEPVVVDGLVVAQRGETVGGRVVEAKKAGRVKGVSQLGARLTDLTLVDGQQAPIRSNLVGQTGPTSRGRDVGAVAATTTLGAAVGAAANGGVGAAVGAGAGAIAGTMGVLLTRGHPTVIYPESLLTFRVEAPVAISTVRAPEAFREVNEDAYAQPSEAQNSTPVPRCADTSYGCPPPPLYYYGPFYYGYGGPALYPYYFGPTFFFGRGGFYRYRR
ncbi:MAG: hypothetical protein ACRD1J_07130 [Terriglobia bacterium]